MGATNINKFILGAGIYTEAAKREMLVELIGDYRVLIENHYGVTTYDINEIHIQGKGRSLCVRGCKLELTNMTKSQLVITGKIECVYWL
ncbi:MAG: YabP/YqfC family sporulation protein [Oscillospiraceae bacterium]|nr:YabP/YqfC family sporulation protein [Oscillospiraceae bacterium]